MTMISASGVLSMTRASLQRYFSVLERCRVILEVGAQSAWVRQLLESLGHEVITANSSKLLARGVSGSFINGRRHNQQ